MEWPAWRLVLSQVATLGELDGENATYSLDDIRRANAMLDCQAAAQAQEMERMK